MDYTLYRAEDFAADESFISYHLRSNATDVAFWKEWISLHPEKMDEVIQAEQLLDRLYMRISEEELEAEQQRMQAFVMKTKYRQGLEDTNTPVTMAAKKRKQPVLAWVAASVIIIAVAIIAYTLTRAKPIQWQTYNNAPGKKATLTLDDGSQVILNAGATVQYHRWKEGDSMRVKLNGEAYFEVTPNMHRVFLVKAGDVDITVLGTGFNVLSIPQETIQSIALVHGKVHVHTPHGDVLLQPNQEALYAKQTGSLQVKAFDNEIVAGWKDGIIKWEGASFEEVAATLKKKHNIILVNKTGAVPAPYTGRFENTPIEAIIKSYCYTHRYAYTIHGDQVILQNQR